MKKKAIIVCLIVLSIVSIVVYQEVAEFKRRRDDPLAKKMRRLGLQYYPDREIGDDLEEAVYYYVALRDIEIEGNEYPRPTLLICRTTDCLSGSSLKNIDVSSLKYWSFNVKDKKSQIKAFYDAIDAIKSDYPWLYNVKIISLSFYGQISHEQLWPLKPIITFDDENF